MIVNETRILTTRVTQETGFLLLGSLLAQGPVHSAGTCHSVVLQGRRVKHGTLVGQVYRWP